MRKFLTATFWIAAVTLPIATASAAAISLTGASGTYNQNFDGLISTGTGTWADDSTIAGWFAVRSGTGTSIAASTGSATGGNLYSFGATSNSDRALGSIGSGNAAAGNFAWGAYFVNDTGSTISQVDIGYTGEQWRKSGDTVAQTIGFSYRVNGSGFSAPSGAPTNPNPPLAPSGWTSVSSLNFTSPLFTSTGAALDGNNAANRTVFASSTITGLTLAPGEVLWIRWDDPDHIGGDHGLSIDDFSLSWQTGAVALNDTVITPVSSSVDFGRVVANGSGTILLNKTGNETTTFSVATTGGFTASGGAFVAGTVNNQALAVNVGSTLGVRNGTVTIDNNATTSAAAGQGSDDPNDDVNVAAVVVNNRFVNSGAPATPSTNNFGAIIVGQSKTQDITLQTTNGGDQSVNSLTSITIPAAATVTLVESTAGNLKSSLSLANASDVLVNDGSVTVTRSATLTANATGNVSTSTNNYARFSSVPEGLPGETSDPHSRLYYQFTGLTSADASFDSTTSEKSLTIPLGNFVQNTGTFNPTFSFNLSNLETTTDFTAGLDLTGFLAGLGSANIDIGALDSVDNLAATLSQLINGTAAINTNGAPVGLLSRAFTLQLRDDENIAGFQAQTLTLTLEANITPIPEPSGLVMLALALAGLGAFRRRWR